MNRKLDGVRQAIWDGVNPHIVTAQAHVDASRWNRGAVPLTRPGHPAPPGAVVFPRTPPPQWKVGDEVRMRDKGGREWQRGVVQEIVDGKPKVRQRAFGHSSRGCFYDEVCREELRRFSDGVIRSGSGRRKLRQSSFSPSPPPSALQAAYNSPTAHSPHASYHSPHSGVRDAHGGRGSPGSVEPVSSPAGARPPTIQFPQPSCSPAGSDAGGAGRPRFSSGPPAADDGLLHFRVCDPRMAIPDYYWVYHVETRTSLGWKSRALRVRHRFSDFEFLRRQLLLEHPGAIVPPLPEYGIQGHIEKVVLRSADRLSYRQRALTRFLSAVGAHPRLRHSPALRAFCEADGAEWEAFRAQRRQQRPGPQPVGWYQRLLRLQREGYFRVTQWLSSGATPAAAAAAASPGPRPPADLDIHQCTLCSGRRLEQRKAHAARMHSMVVAAGRLLAQQLEARRRTAAATTAVAGCLRNLGRVEKRHAERQRIRAADGCTVVTDARGGDPKLNAQLGDDFHALGQYAASSAKPLLQLSDREAQMVGETMDFYAGAFASVEEVVRRLEGYQLSVLTEHDKLGKCADAESDAELGTPWRRTCEAAAAEQREALGAACARWRAALQAFDDDWARFLRHFEREWILLRRLLIELQVSHLRQTEQLTHPPIIEPDFADTMFGEGVAVTVLKDFVSNSKDKVRLRSGQRGVIKSIDAAGDAYIRFDGMGGEWVWKQNFVHLARLEILRSSADPLTRLTL